MANTRWGAFRTIATALRTATRPGSPALGERLSSLPRLVRATFRGDYRGSSRGRLLMVLGAALYVISPVDFMPEAVLSVFGLADDAMVVSWIAATVVNETEAFLAWERTAPQGQAQAGRSRTVPGHVVG